MYAIIYYKGKKNEKGERYDFSLSGILFDLVKMKR